MLELWPTSGCLSLISRSCGWGSASASAFRCNDSKKPVFRLGFAMADASCIIWRGSLCWVGDVRR